MAPGSCARVSSDIGEGGIAVQLAHRPKNLGPVSVQFSLPGTQHKIECTGEVAWENPGRQVGLRFLDLTPAMRDDLNQWLASRAPEFEQDDPPAPCKLTDLSLGGCYLDTASPFPPRHSHHPLHEGCRGEFPGPGHGAGDAFRAGHGN